MSDGPFVQLQRTRLLRGLEGRDGILGSPHRHLRSHFLNQDLNRQHQILHFIRLQIHPTQQISLIVAEEAVVADEQVGALRDLASLASVRDRDHLILPCTIPMHSRRNVFQNRDPFPDPSSHLVHLQALAEVIHNDTPLVQTEAHRAHESVQGERPQRAPILEIDHRDSLRFFRRAMTTASTDHGDDFSI